MRQTLSTVSQLKHITIHATSGQQSLLAKLYQPSAQNAKIKASNINSQLELKENEIDERKKCAYTDLAHLCFIMQGLFLIRGFFPGYALVRTTIHLSTELIAMHNQLP